jgi:nucleotide-binding universal stress UspA family protein
MRGGRNASGTHQDFLFLDPTVTASWPDGHETPVIVSGRITRARRHHEIAETLPWNDILVVVDLNAQSERAVTVADRIARQNDATLTVCHIINTSIPVNVIYPQISAMTTGIEDLRQEHADAVRHINAMVNDLTGRRPDEYEVVVFLGDPIRSVLEYASNHGTDLIVVPAGPDRHYGRRFASIGFRSLAEHASCDVLVAR